MSAKLTGQALLAYVQENSGLDMATMIEGAGYSAMRNGRPGLKKTEFFTALSAAQGITIGETLSQSQSSRQPNYQVKASSRGVIPLSSCYANMLDVQPGEYVKIEREDDVLILSKLRDEPPQPCAILA
tara:strand:- start:26 stop:409 length:384 start_codon:yes stop_codon:yes gene_type:complete